MLLDGPVQLLHIQCPHSGAHSFTCNCSQAYEPGLSISSAGFLYAPCIIGNFPVGAVVAPAAISISPLGVYITPEGANFQPEGVDVRSPRSAEAARACLACLGVEQQRPGLGCC